MADIGSLIVKIGADASGLQKAFSDLGGSAGKFQQGLGNLAKIGGAAFVAIAASMTAMTIAAGQQAEALQQLSAITGINTDTLQEYDVLLGRVGLDGSDLTVVMRTLSKNMEEAQNGTGMAADRFRQLGIDIRRVTSTDDLIRKIAESVSKFSSGTEKAAIVGDLLGKSGLKFIPAFEGGAAAIREAARASEQLGAALSSGQLAELGNMDDRIDDLTLAWKRFGQQLGSFVAPIIDFAAKAMTNLLSIASQGLKSLNALGGVNAAAETRQKPPALIDTAKRAQEQQALIDAQFRATEQGFRDATRLAQAENANYSAQLEQKKATGVLSTRELVTAQQGLLENMSKFEIENLNRSLENYRTFAKAKEATFTSDAKGRADRQKFMEDSAAKEKTIINDLAVAQINAETSRIESGLRLTTFWQEQLQALVASNAFSVGQIVTTWTSGVANAIVTGGDFVKAAWQSTQVAIIQGGLNLAVQWAAQQALMATASSTAAGVTTGVWAGATTAITGFFGLFTAALSTMFANLVVVMTAVGTFVMNVLGAIASALSATIFGIPFAGAILLGIALIAAALALSGNLGFKEGGIGDFGSGTPAMLHGPEAVIPLNSRGASFMQEAFGGGKGQIIHTHVYLKGREIAMAVSDDLPSALRTAGLPA